MDFKKFANLSNKAKLVAPVYKMSSNAEDSFKLISTPRMTIQAPKGYLIASCDYSSQEIYCAAVVSKDQAMLDCFLDTVPSKIDVPTNYNGDYVGHEHLGANPAKDIHTQAGMKAYPQYFKNKPSYEWCCIARETIVTNKKTIRAIGKFCRLVK